MIENYNQINIIKIKSYFNKKKFEDFYFFYDI
jgi:hypothetical protein